MADICTDNRFELIKKYKDKLIEATNIESDEDEMKVIDNILFRCWQMRWLDRLESIDDPVVWCKDCIHFKQFRPTVGICKISGRMNVSEFFCADGERRPE